MASELKSFIRIVDDEGFESHIELLNPSDLYYFLKNLKVGTKVQMRLIGWFGLNSEIVAPDATLPD